MAGAMEWTETGVDTDAGWQAPPLRRIALLTRAIDGRPNDARLAVALARAHLALGDQAAALRAFAAALALDPHGFDDWPAMIDCHLKSGDPAAALELCDLHSQPDDASWRRQRGVALLRLRRTAEGRAELVHALALGDPMLRALRALLTSLAQSSDGGPLLEKCESLDDRYRETAGARGFRAVALSKLGRRDDACETIDLARCVMRVPVTPPEPFGGIDDFNEALAAEILREPGRTSAEGETFDYHARTIGKPALTAVRAAIRAAMVDYIDRRAAFAAPAALPDPPRRALLSCGTVILAGPGRNGQHVHPTGYLSAVYHVTAPPAADADDLRGALILGPCDRIAGGHQACWGTRTFQVRPGWITLFPSHIFHDVIPTGSATPRVSVVSDLNPTPHGMRPDRA